MWTTLKKRCPHCPQPQQMQCQPGTHINQDSAAPHRIPEATSSASAEPGHPQILPRRLKVRSVILLLCAPHETAVGRDRFGPNEREAFSAWARDELILVAI